MKVSGKKVIKTEREFIIMSIESRMVISNAVRFMALEKKPLMMERILKALGTMMN